MNLKPLFDRVILKPKSEDKTKSGIVLASASDEKPTLGEVVAIGDGTTPDGKKIEMKVKVGDKVLFEKFSGYDCEIDGENFVIVRQGDILGIMEK